MKNQGDNHPGRLEKILVDIDTDSDRLCFGHSSFLERHSTDTSGMERRGRWARVKIERNPPHTALTLVPGTLRIRPRGNHRDHWEQIPGYIDIGSDRRHSGHSWFSQRHSKDTRGTLRMENSDRARTDKVPSGQMRWFNGPTTHGNAYSIGSEIPGRTSALARIGRISDTVGSWKRIVSARQTGNTGSVGIGAVVAHGTRLPGPDPEATTAAIREESRVTLTLVRIGGILDTVGSRRGIPWT